MEQLIIKDAPIYNANRFYYQVNNKDVAMCYVCKEDLYLCDVEVLLPYRNQGYGTKMIQEIIKHYIGQPLWLYVYEFNMAAQRVYTKCGFTVTATTRFGDNLYYRMELKNE